MFLKGELFFIVGIFIDDETIDDNIRMNKILLKTTIIFTALFSLNVVASPLDLLVVIPMGVLLGRKHYRRKGKVTK